MTDLTITKEAAGKAMTLAELRELVAECDDLHLPGSMVVEARGGWSGTRRLTVKRAKAARPAASAPGSNPPLAGGPPAAPATFRPV